MSSKLGIIGYNNYSGLGNLIKNFRRNLPIECQFVIQHPLKPASLDDIKCEYVEGSLSPTIEEFESFLDLNPTTVIIIETPFNWEFIPLMKKKGIRIIYIPMIDCVRFDEMRYKEQIDYWIMFNRIGFALTTQYRMKNSEYLPYPIDTDYFEFKQRDGNLFLHNAGYYELVKGQPDAHKGTDLAIQAFAHLPECKLLINSMTDIPFAQNRQNVKLNINIFEDPRDLYKEGDIYIAPSRWEGLGLPLYEAMASGMVLITTDAPPMNDIPIDKDFKIGCVPFEIPHGIGMGYQCNIENLVNAIEKIASRPELVHKISIKNRLIIENQFSWSTLRKKYERILKI